MQIICFSSHSYNIMLQCWSMSPHERPSFAKLKNTFVDKVSKKQRKSVLRRFYFLSSISLKSGKITPSRESHELGSFRRNFGKMKKDFPKGRGGEGRGGEGQHGRCVHNRFHHLKPLIFY